MSLVLLFFIQIALFRDLCLAKVAPLHSLWVCIFCGTSWGRPKAPKICQNSPNFLWKIVDISQKSQNFNSFFQLSGQDWRNFPLFPFFELAFPWCSRARLIFFIVVISVLFSVYQDKKDKIFPLLQFFELAFPCSGASLIFNFVKISIFFPVYPDKTEEIFFFFPLLKLGFSCSWARLTFFLSKFGICFPFIRTRLTKFSSFPLFWVGFSTKWDKIEFLFWLNNFAFPLSDLTAQYFLLFFPFFELLSLCSGTRLTFFFTEISILFPVYRDKIDFLFCQNF